MNNIEGIYILANDVVYNQLVALLNSIQVNAGADFPVCIIPYDDNLHQVKQEILKRENVTIFNENQIIKQWENFSAQVWENYPEKMKTIWHNLGKTGVYRMGMHRRFCGFDGSFEKFIYLDADILILNSLQMFFDQLESQDFITYDFQYKDISHVYNIHSNQVTKVFDQSRIDKEIFCAGLFATKKGLFPPPQRAWLISQLKQGEAEILYIPAPDQSLLNYMVMKTGISNYNLALNLPAEQVTGCSVTSLHFAEKDHLVYDHGQQLTYLHYIGLPAEIFNRVCGGENIDFPYRETFLHYRYLHEPEKRPKFTGKAKPYNAPPSLMTRLLRKLGTK